MKVSDFIEKLIPGETVVIEHDAKTSPVTLFYSILGQGRKQNSTVLIDDFMDTLYLYKAHLELSGFDTSLINNSQVIKIGGIRDVGNVVEKIPLSPGPPLKEQYRMAYNRVVSSHQTVLNLCLGIEKFFVLSDSRIEILSEVADISLYVGDTSRIAIYFINRDILKEVSPSPLPFLEALATTLGELKHENKHYVIAITKSANLEIEGKKIEVKF